VGVTAGGRLGVGAGVLGTSVIVEKLVIRGSRVGGVMGAGIEDSGIIRGGAVFLTKIEEKKDPKERMGGLGEATDSGERRGSITFSGAGRAQSKTVGE
jgi:hypothetical protein